MSRKEKPGLTGFGAEFYQNFKEELIFILLKLFHTIETEEILPNTFYEAAAILIPNPHKDSRKNENYRTVFLINTDTKILSKILTN